MAYDQARKRVVLFGGEVSDNGIPAGSNRDTWEWDGERWIEIPPQSAIPAPRAFAAMTYDPVRKLVVMVGGDDRTGSSGQLADTWTWDGASWTQLQTTGSPPAGGFGSIAFDPIAGAIVYAGAGNTASTWRLTGSTWSQVSATGAFWKAGMAWDVVGQRILAFGGDAANVTQTTIRQLGPSGWTTVGSMVGRTAFSIAADVDRRTIVIHGGLDSTGGSIAITSEGRDSLVNVAASTSPPVRIRPAVAWSPNRGAVVLFSGLGAPPDTWELDRQGWHLMSPATAPTDGRYAGAMVHDAARRQIVLFGGTTSANVKLADTWVYDDSSGSWSQKSPTMAPSPRLQHAMAYDATRARVVLFGGNDANGVTGDTWEWDGTNWALVATTGPAPRANHMMTYDTVRQRIVLTGGGEPGLLPGDTWEWDGTAWSNVTPATGPVPQKFAGGFAWDPARRRSVLFGGVPIDDVIWEWDGTVWTTAVAPGPTPRASNMLATDPRGAGVIMIGGSDIAASQNDTWRLSYRGDQEYESCRETTDLDGDGGAGCADIDCWATCTPLCPPATSCDPAAPRCGDGTCNTALETHRACPGDCMTIPACGDFLCESPETTTNCPGDCP
jgi:hypothetical protein